MTNKERAAQILKKLEEKHLNLYHSVSKERVQEFFESCEWEGLNEIQFDYNMLKLFALFKDAHTTFCACSKRLPNNFVFVQGKAYMRRNGVFREIVSINNVEIDKVIDLFDEIVPYEVKEWRDVCISKKLGDAVCYQMFGIYGENGLDVLCKTENGLETFNTKLFSQEELDKLREEGKLQPITQFLQKNYSYVIENGVLKLRYLRCQDDSELSFKDFTREIERLYKEGGFEGYILDIRNNGGGSSNVIMPFLRFVEKNNLSGVVLMNGNTFSSGFLCALDMKREAGATTVGESCGMGKQHYGEVRKEVVDDREFYYCVKKFDYSDYFDYEGGFRPDVYAPKTIDDYNNNTDSQLEKAMEVLEDLIEERKQKQVE